MGYVVTLVGFRPAPRTDQPWLSAGIEEAPAAGGPWTTIDVAHPLDPPDIDSMNPLSRSFTTTNATAESGLWYRIVFYDADGNTQASAPSLNAGSAAAIPSTSEIRDESDVGWDEYAYPLPEPGEPDRLEAKRLDAIADFRALTGVDPSSLADDSIWLRPVRKAIRLLTEYNVTSNTHDVAETGGDFDLLSNYSVGPYSETRRSPGGNVAILHPDPRVNRLLTIISEGIGKLHSGDNGPDIAFADENPSVPAPGERQLGYSYPPGVSPPPTLAPLYTDW